MNSATGSHPRAKRTEPAPPSAVASLPAWFPADRSHHIHMGAVAAQHMRASLNTALGREFPAWVKQVLTAPAVGGLSVSRGSWQVAGVMDPREVAALTREGVAPLSAEIAVEDRLLVGAKARRHNNAGDAIAEQVWENLPAMLQAPLAVAYDTRSGHLIYILEEGSARRPQLAVEVEYPVKKPKRTINMIVSAYRPLLENLQGDIRSGVVRLIRGDLK